MKKFMLFMVSLAMILPLSGTAVAGLGDGLMAYYPFTGNANDSSGNENHGTVNGATLTTDRLGNANSAYSFDGEDDYIKVPNSQSIDVAGNTISIAAWAYCTGSVSSGYIVDKYRNIYNLSLVDSPAASADGTPRFVVNKWPHVLDASVSLLRR